MKAPEFLEAAAGHMRDRAATYDKPEGERSMPSAVAAFNAITGHNLTAEQGWLLQVVLKCVRAQQGNYKSDNYEDGAAYFALMGEQASVDRMTVAEAREIVRKTIAEISPFSPPTGPSEIVSSEFLFDTEQLMQHLTKARHPVTLEIDKAFPDLAADVKEKLFDLIVNDAWTMWTGGENPVPGETCSVFLWCGKFGSYKGTANAIVREAHPSDKWVWFTPRYDEETGAGVIAYKVIPAEVKALIKPEIGKTYRGDLHSPGGVYYNVEFFVESIGSAGVGLRFTDVDSASPRFFAARECLHIHEEVKPK